jgi:mannose-1-phosphate guanylyltransferase
MKAFLLAAGLGTRLHPLTLSVPKCMLPVGGRPLLDYWLLLLARHGITEVLINLHHRAEDVERYLAENSHGLAVRTFHEPTLLGSGGTLWVNRDWVVGEECFLVAYADNLTNADLSALVRAHRRERPVLTAALWRTDQPREFGIVVLDQAGTIIDFEEKPQRPRGELANAGLYVTGPEVFDYFEERIPLDIGFDVLPRLVGRMTGFVLQEYLLDIGNHERYARANRDVDRLGFDAVAPAGRQRPAGANDPRPAGPILTPGA